MGSPWLERGAHRLGPFIRELLVRPVPCHHSAGANQIWLVHIRPSDWPVSAQSAHLGKHRAIMTVGIALTWARDFGVFFYGHVWSHMFWYRGKGGPKQRGPL